MSFSPHEVIVLVFFTSLLTISFVQFINPLYDESKNVHSTTRILNVLWTVGAIFILYIIFLMLNILPTSMKLKTESNILLSSIGISLSAFIASASVMKNIANTNHLENLKKEKENSEFYLNKSISELTNVYDLLKDKNNDRVTWILASRVLLMSLELSKKIKLENHKEFYNLQELQLKHKLMDLFNSAEYKTLAFYIGIEKPLEVEETTAIIKYIYEKGKIEHLDEASLYEIFSFLEYPKDFSDPLNDDKLPKNENEMDSWCRKNSSYEYKLPIKKYFELLEDKNGHYTKFAYEKTTW